MNREARIVVVGSFAVGLTIRLERFPAPGETLLGSGYRMDHGGKGSNQAVGCARLGVKSSLVARIGNDAFGEMALELYGDEGVDSSHVEQVPGHPTGVAFILVKSGTGENSIALDPGANALLDAEAVAASDALISSAQVVLTQLEIPVEPAAAAMARGRAHGAITILNPAPARPVPDEVLANVDILTPNESEAKTLLGHPPDARIAPEDLGRELLKHGPKRVIVTLGEQGAFIATPEFESHVPAISVPAVDTTGAGDAFTAGLAVALARGVELEAAVRFAAVTGGLAVTKQGVIPGLPDLAEVAEHYRQSKLDFPAGWLTGA